MRLLILLALSLAGCGSLPKPPPAPAAPPETRRPAADMAKLGRPVNGDGLRPGDLVFFNTRNSPRSHVGIYIGDGRFVHAPNSNGRIRADSLTSG
mgnify:CR=1 FL=1